MNSTSCDIFLTSEAFTFFFYGCACLKGKYWVPFSELWLNLNALLDPWEPPCGWPPHLYLNPATLSLYTSYHFLALPFPFCLSSTFPPQGYPLLLSWPPAAHCEVGSRLLSWALTALLSLALMQVDFALTYDLASLPPSLIHTYFSIPTSLSSLGWKNIFVQLLNKNRSDMVTNALPPHQFHTVVF